LNPDLFTFGDATVSAYRVAILIAFALGLSIGTWDAWRQGINPWKALQCGIFSTVGGLVGARALYVILNWSDFMDNPDYIFMLRFAGLSVQGAIAGAIIFALLWCYWQKFYFFQMTDLMAPYWALGYAIVRAVGCNIAGCCYGLVADVPWAVTMVNVDDLPRHPVQLYAAALAVIGMIIIIYLRKRRPFYGMPTVAVIGLYGILRFITEFFREDNVFFIWEWLTAAQFASIIMIIISGLLLHRMYSIHNLKQSMGLVGPETQMIAGELFLPTLMSEAENKENIKYKQKLSSEKKESSPSSSPSKEKKKGKSSKKKKKSKK